MQRFNEFVFDNQADVAVLVLLEGNNIQRRYTVPAGSRERFDPDMTDVQTVLICVNAGAGVAEQSEELSVLALPERAYIRRARAVFDIGALHGNVDAAY